MGCPRNRPARLAAASLMLASASAPASVHAQTVATAESTAVVATPMIVANPADLLFGSVASRGAAGTIALSPGATATCTATGGLIHTGACQAARFDGDVTLLFALRVDKPAGNRITLFGPSGATMQAHDFTFAGGPGMLDLGETATAHRWVVLNLDGSFAVYAGATLDVAADQMPGLYTGTFQVQFNYD